MEEQKRVLFVVYRTEWWGCLDSYCRRECLDADTLCYVMPVPRYEREADTLQVNFGKKHFEPEKLAGMLPEEACMVNYETFSLEQGFDRIYIHNPYDNGSPLDTVELQYYSSNLKKYTPKLICVSHFLNLPISDYTKCNAYDYVDAIYVPHRRMKYALEEKYDEKVEVKPSGIPEYLDRLAEKMEAKGELADDRMKLLYCVSFGDLAFGTESQIREMREIFEYARQNRNICLIFRPDEDIPVLRIRHQLSDEIWREYEKLIAFFVKNRIGIYDGTLDLYEMAVLADGILCTRHPMSGLFSVQGKYVLHLDRVHRLAPTTEDRCIPGLWAVVAEEKGEDIELWFVPEKTNLLCKMTISGRADLGASAVARKRNEKKKVHRHMTGPRVDIIAEVPEEMLGGLNYVNLTKIGDELYLSPYVSDGIWKYDIQNNIFTKRYVPDAIAPCVGFTFVYGKYLYMTPRMYPGILKYDRETEEIVVLDEWVEELETHAAQGRSTEPYFVWAVKQEGNMLYMASSKCDVWMELDMDSDTWSLKSMGLPGKMFVDMVKDGEWVWLLPFCGDEIILWNCKSGENHLIYQTINTEPRNVPYSFLLDRGDSVVAFPQQKADHLLVMEKPYPLTGEGGHAESGHGAESQKMEPYKAESQKTESHKTEPCKTAGGLSVDGMKITEVRDGIPCGYGANLTEYQKQLYLGYQFVKRLDSGLILAYEYYDGSFLLLDKELRAIRKIPCRLPIEALRQQNDLIWKYDQYRGEFHGGIHEGFSFPLMMEYFLRHGREDREEIRRHYERDYPRFAFLQDE